MARARNELAALVSDLHTRIARVVELAQQGGRAAALNEIRSLVGGGGGGDAAPVKRGPGRPKGSKNKAKSAAPAKAAGKRKNPWAGLSPAERLARVNAIRKGRGLPLKGE